MIDPKEDEDKRKLEGNNKNKQRIRKIDQSAQGMYHKLSELVSESKEMNTLRTLGAKIWDVRIQARNRSD